MIWFQIGCILFDHNKRPKLYPSTRIDPGQFKDLLANTPKYNVLLKKEKKGTNFPS